MWVTRYWASRYWAHRYWPKGDRESLANPPCGCGLYGDGGFEGDGTLYCNSNFVQKFYAVACEAVGHHFSLRVLASGFRFILHSARMLTHARATQPFNYEVRVDDHRVTRISLRIQHSGSCMKVDTIRPIVSVRNRQPRVDVSI